MWPRRSRRTFESRDFHAALLADDALELHALVLAAQALVVLGRPEDAGAEQAVAFGLEGTVVDGLRLLDLAIGPFERIFSGLAIEIRIWSKTCVACLLIERVHDDSDDGSSACLLRPEGAETATVRLCEKKGTGGGDYSAASWGASSSAPGVSSGPPTCSGSFSVSSTFRPRELISLTRTLKLSGMPASNVSNSPLDDRLVRPWYGRRRRRT